MQIYSTVARPWFEAADDRTTRRSLGATFSGAPKCALVQARWLMYTGEEFTCSGIRQARVRACIRLAGVEGHGSLGKSKDLGGAFWLCGVRDTAAEARAFGVVV